MSSRVKIKWNNAGFRELLKDPAVQAKCMDHAQRAANAAGEHFEAAPRKYPERAGAAVYAADADGFYDNLRNDTIVKSVLATGSGGSE